MIINKIQISNFRNNSNIIRNNLHINKCNNTYKIIMEIYSMHKNTIQKIKNNLANNIIIITSKYNIK